MDLSNIMGLFGQMNNQSSNQKTNTPNIAEKYYPKEASEHPTEQQLNEQKNESNSNGNPLLSMLPLLASMGGKDNGGLLGALGKQGGGLSSLLGKKPQSEIQKKDSHKIYESYEKICDNE